MSTKNKTKIKKKSLNNLTITINNETESESKTNIDSLYISKVYHTEKGTEKNIKTNHIQNNIEIKKDKKKKNNFYNALKTICINNENNDNNIIRQLNTSNENSKNLVSQISEFPESVLDKSKDYNISKYLHHPIVKQITKLGNELIRINNNQAYRVDNGLEINKPLITAYNMKNIFEKFNNSFIDIENSNSNINSKISDENNRKIEKSKNIIEGKIKNYKKIKNKNIKFFHKKNKSSITNYYFNDNNSTNTIINCNHKKNNRYVIHYRDNISSLIGGQNRIIYKDKESNTTGITKDDYYLKDIMQIHELNDINININIFNNNNNNRDLEIISDYDETKEKNLNSTNKKNEINNSSNQKDLIIKNEYTNSIPKNIFNNNKRGKTSTETKGNNICGNNEQNNNIGCSQDREEENDKIKTFNKFNNYSLNKTLRKKYERTEFKFKYIRVNNNRNNFIMKNLINKFEQCSNLKNSNKTLENYNDEIIESNDTNKNNDTVVIKEEDNGLILNVDVSAGNESFIKNFNIQDNVVDTITNKKVVNDISKINIKSILNNNDFNNIDSKINNNNNKSKDNIKIDKLLNNYSLNLNDVLNIKKWKTIPLTNEGKNKNNKYNYSTPECGKGKSFINLHHFNINSPFLKDENNGMNIKLPTVESNKNELSQLKQQPQSVYDYSFYQKLLNAEEKMAKNCKFLENFELILNTEIRLEILLWMMKTCEEFAFKRDTYHNACYYFDMFLIINNQKLNDKSELELIGLTCIVISAKLEEIQLPRLKEYAELLSNSQFNIKSIIEMEKKICSKLSWRLIIITKNIWLSWYICQWDLFIDTIDNIKEELLNLLTEDDILYYKKPNDNSYYNFRKISQLIDIMTLDYYSYCFEPRILIAACFFVLICYNYKFKYNFVKKKFENNTPLSDLLFNLYKKFITQSFDYNFDDEKVQKAIKYTYNYINFPFVFDLPLLYQVHQSKLDGDSYEDFLSYQTTNDNYYKIMKERIDINKMTILKKKKNCVINKNSKYGMINGQNTIFHRKNFSSNISLNVNNKK